MGKPGRKILREVLPQWKEKYKPDAIIVNVENLAHGKGVTPSTLAEIDDLGIDCFTSGNHIFKKGDLTAESFEKYPKLIRPANFGDALPGHGYYRFSKRLTPPFRQLADPPHELGRENNTAKSLPSPRNGEGQGEVEKFQQFLVVNLNGQVFMEKQFDGPIANPFLAVDQLISEQGQKGDIIIVDFHAEATSEKVAMGLHLNGKVAGVFGTHTHIPTADARVLSGGTGYVTDVGMVGTRDSILGVIPANALKRFLNSEEKFVYEVEEEGVLQINGVLVEVDENQKVVKIEKLYQEVWD